MQKNWLQWSPFFFFFWEKIRPSQWLNIWITHLGTYYNNFTYVSLPSRNTENAQKTLQNTEMHKKHIGSNLIENLKIFGGLIVIQFSYLLYHITTKLWWYNFLNQINRFVYNKQESCKKEKQQQKSRFDVNLHIYDFRLAPAWCNQSNFSPITWKSILYLYILHIFQSIAFVVIHDAGLFWRMSRSFFFPGLLKLNNRLLVLDLHVYNYEFKRNVWSIISTKQFNVN